MIGTKIAIAAKANKIRVYRKAKKQLEIKAKYKAKLATWDIDLSPLQLKTPPPPPITSPP